MKVKLRRKKPLSKIQRILREQQPRWKRACKELKRLEEFQSSINDEAGLLSRLKNVQKTEDRQFSARCPAHDDNRNSLSIRIGDDGKILLNCHAECSTEEVVEAVGLEMRDLFPVVSSFSGKQKILETYDYKDENGELLYQVCRLDPKGFLQRKPDGKGGWIYKIAGVRRVLYRLPELIAAGNEAPQFIVEGEKDVDNLQSLRLNATCNSGGAGNWRSEFNSFFRGRDVVLLPDNDPPGRKYVEKIAGQLKSIARSIKVIELPDLLSGEDVSDWLDKGNTKNDLLKLVEESKPWNDNHDSEFVSFPTSILPTPLAEYVQVGASALDCDESYVAIPLLTALASAIGNTRRIQLKSTWCEPCVLWTVIVGDSGTVKSPALELSRYYHDKLQKIAFEDYETRLQEFEQENALYDADFKQWKKSGNRDKLPPLPISESVCRRYLCSDTTVEALAPLLKNNPRGLFLIRDELAGWINGFDLYKSSGGTDVTHWLSIHGARPMTVDRKTGNPPTIHVSRAAVSITGSIQPMSLALALGQKHFENGLAARLLFCFPPRRQRRWTETETPEKLQQAISKVFAGLFELKFGQDDDGIDVPIDLKLNKKAKKKWINFYNQHAAEQMALQGNIAAAWSKLEGYAARLALVIHLVRVVAGDKKLADPELIDEISMDTGIKLCRWFGNEAARIYAAIGGSANPEELERIRQLLEYIRGKGGRITARKLQKGPQRYRKPGAAEKALNELEEYRLGKWQVIDTTGRQRSEFILDDGGDGTG